MLWHPVLTGTIWRWPFGFLPLSVSMHLMVLDACYLAGGAPLWWVPFALAKCALWRSVLVGERVIRRADYSFSVLMHLMALGAFWPDFTVASTPRTYES